MTSQNPITEFENYPLRPDAAEPGIDGRAATPPPRRTVSKVVAPPRTDPAADGRGPVVDTRQMGWSLSPQTHPRRTALGWLVSIPVVAILGVGILSSQAHVDGSGTDFAPDSGFDALDDIVWGFCPEDWGTFSDSTGAEGIRHGSNQATVLVLEDFAESDAELMALALEAVEPSLSADPSKTSRRSLEGNSAIELRSTGKVGGKKARQIIDVIPDDNTGTALVITQLLTAAPESALANQAQTFVHDVAGVWPW